MSGTINRINGLSISAADAQYVAAGNVDGPLGYNSISSASYALTASYVLSNANSSGVVIDGYSLKSVSPIEGGIAASSTYGIFLGYSAAANAAGAQYSNIIGHQAGTFATNANTSNFIGLSAGYNASEANNSNFIGTITGDSATSASYSNFIGYSAGAYATTANNSNFIGYFAGVGAKLSVGSNFIGNSAGYYAQSASYSILIGFKAGANYTPFSGSTSVGNNNIIIGNNITLSGSARNSINIGGILFGTGSYSTLNGNAFSGSAGGRIGINVVSPTYNFQVSGSVAFTNLTTANQSNVVTIDTATGQLYYTASSALGGGGGSAATASWAIQAQTASYSTTLGASIANASGGRLRLFNSDGNLISQIDTFTASLALGVSSSVVTDASDYRVAMFAADNQALVRTSGTNILYTPNPGRLSVPHITATSLTGSLQGTASWATNATTASHALTLAGTATNATSASFASTASYLNNLNQNVTINGNLTVFGTASYTLVSASQLNVGSNTISVNVFEPQQRFGGLVVYDSGSSAATASLLWDSLNNKWIYQNVSGSGYDGGMAIFGPRNTSGLGNEQGTTNNALMKGQGEDHVTSSRIFDDGTNVYTNSNVQVTGSLTIIGSAIATSFTGSLQGTGSWAVSSSNATYATSAGNASTLDISVFGSPVNSYVLLSNVAGTTGVAVGSDADLRFNASTNVLTVGNVSATTLTGSLQGTGSWANNAVTASYSLTSATASYVLNAVSSSYSVSSSYAANGGVTQIIAGTNVTISPTNGLGAVTINSTGGGSSGAGANVTASFTNQSTWTFVHALANRNVVVQAYDTSWNQIIPQNITLTDSNTATLTFPTNESGYAIASLGGVVSTAATASYVLNAVSSSFASTASFVNTLNQNVLISGSVTVSSATSGPSENSLTLGARDNGAEGGQLGFNPGPSYASASFLDVWQNSFRLLKGTSAGSNASLASVDLTTGHLTLNPGSIIMPARPAFRVVGAGTGAGADKSVNAILSGSLVTVDYNQGSYYNNTNGQFTCPLAGLYHVWYVGRSQNASGPNSVAVLKNNGTVLAFWENNNANIGHFGTSAVVSLAANDVVTAKVTAGTITFDSNDNWGVAYIG